MASGCSIFDALCYPGPFTLRLPDQPYSMDDLLAEHERYGITHRLCLHAESRDGTPEEGNQEMIRLADGSPGTEAAWTVLPTHRFHGEKVDSLMARAQSERVAMFAMFPETQLHLMTPWADNELFKAMASVRLPLMLDIRQTNYDAVFKIASAYSSMPVVLWHVLYSCERFVIPLMDLCDNVFVGLGERFIPSRGIEEFSARYGPHRLIFGSTWPVQSPGPLISYVMYAEVDRSVKQAILSDNITRLLSDVAWKTRVNGNR